MYLFNFRAMIKSIDDSILNKIIDFYHSIVFLVINLTLIMCPHRYGLCSNLIQTRTENFIFQASDERKSHADKFF